MDNKVRIEKLRREDIDSFFEFFSKSILTQFPEYSIASKKWLISSPQAFSKERMMRGVGEKESLWLLAYVKNHLAGFIYGEKPWGGVCDIYWLVVDSNLQRKGIGRSLLMEFEKIVKKLGAHSIHLRTDPRNLEFYKKAGYDVIGLETKTYLGTDDYVLKKLIQEPKEENFLR